MKSLKVLTLLTLAAALFCGANGSPATGATTDGHFIKRQNKQELNHALYSISDIFRSAYVKEKGKSNRAGLNKAVVKQLGENNAHYNYVISAVKHKGTFEGKEGVDWGHWWITKDGIDYDIFVGGAGSFTLDGKSEYENWAWDGILARDQDLRSTTIRFLNPVTPGGSTRSTGGG
ncbi:hypothetical protein JOM56_005558 [Amanita muscaria]